GRHLDPRLDLDPHRAVGGAGADRTQRRPAFARRHRRHPGCDPGPLSLWPAVRRGLGRRAARDAGDGGAGAELHPALVRLADAGCAGPAVRHGLPAGGDEGAQLRHRRGVFEDRCLAGGAVRDAVPARAARLGHAAGDGAGHHRRGAAVAASQARRGGGPRAGLDRQRGAVGTRIGRRVRVVGRRLPRCGARAARHFTMAGRRVGRAVGAGGPDPPARRLAARAGAGRVAGHRRAVARVGRSRADRCARVDRLVHRVRADHRRQRAHAGPGRGGVQLPGLAPPDARETLQPGNGRTGAGAGGPAGDVRHAL
ncbi:MAG: Bll0213 protein, partial [uncultured Ramlibacter sp.]